MCPATNARELTYNQSRTLTVYRRVSQRRGVEREKPLSLSYPIRERLCYADEKMLHLFPDGIGAPSELLKLLIIYKLLKHYVRLTFSKVERRHDTLLGNGWRVKRKDLLLQISFTILLRLSLLTSRYLLADMEAFMAQDRLHVDALTESILRYRDDTSRIVVRLKVVTDHHIDIDGVRYESRTFQLTTLRQVHDEEQHTFGLLRLIAQSTDGVLLQLTTIHLRLSRKSLEGVNNHNVVLLHRFSDRINVSDIGDRHSLNVEPLASKGQLEAVLLPRSVTNIVASLREVLEKLK